MTKLRLGVRKDAPTTLTTLHPYGYDLCAIIESSSSTDTMLHFECANYPRGQYVVIQQGGLGHTLAVCEFIVVIQGNSGTWRPNQNGRRFSGDVFICIFFTEIVRLLIQIGVNCVPGGSIDNTSAFVQEMAWCWEGDNHYLNQLHVWQSSWPASFSPVGLTLWPNWLDRCLATLSSLSTQVRIPVGSSVPERYTCTTQFANMYICVTWSQCIN